MWGQCAGTGFTEDVSKITVVQGDTHHVNRSIIRSRFVGEEELVDLSIVHPREMGKSCGIDKGNLWSNQQGQRGQSFRGDWSWSYCLW